MTTKISTAIRIITDDDLFPAQVEEIEIKRRMGTATALGYIVAGNPGRARYELTRSVLAQWRTACGGEIPIEPAGPVPLDVARRRVAEAIRLERRGASA